MNWPRCAERHGSPGPVGLARAWLTELLAALLAALALCAEVWAQAASGAAAMAQVPASSLAVSAAQSRWLAAHAPVRFGPERDYGPFVYQLADGRLAGLSVDMLRLVQAHTGMVLLDQPAAPLHDLLSAARARQVDLLLSLRPTPERAKFLRFTQPYVSVPAVLVRRASDPVRTLAELADQPVAVGKGYAVEAVVRQRHPQVRWTPLSDDGAALQALLRGEVQAVVADAASVAFVLRARQLQGLRMDAPVGFEYTLSFAVRSDWPELVDIINRAIQQIGQAERQRLLDQWLAVPGAPALPVRSWRAVAWGLGLLGLSVLGGIGLWLQQRRRRQRQATAPGPGGTPRHG